MAKNARELKADAKKLGFEYVGQNGGNHHTFVNAEGVRINTSLSPSDQNAWKNAIRDMEKASGRFLPRKNAGKPHFKPQQQCNMHASGHEMQISSEVDALLARASLIRSEFQQLVAVPNRTSAVRARKLLADYEEFRQLLAVHHRILDPIV